MRVDGFTSFKALASVNINGLWVPGNSAPSQLGRFIEPAIFYNPDFPDFELSNRGTLTKCKVNDQYFGLVTVHQLSDFNNDQLVLFNNQKRRIHSAGHVVYARDRYGNEEKYDLRLFDFTRAIEYGDYSSGDWFNLTSQIDESANFDDAILLAFGYPTSEQSHDYEVKHIKSVWAYLYGKKHYSLVNDRKTFKVTNSDEIEVDGLSGGAVFSIGLDKQLNAQLVFSGIVTNASQSFVNYLPVEKVKDFIAHL